MRKNYHLQKILPALLFAILVNVSNGQIADPARFADPPIHFRPRPLWFWNNTTVTEAGIVQQMQALRDDCGYGGFGVIPFGKKFQPKYLSDDYFRLYGVMLSKAKELGMTISLYDELGFPSGSVGAFGEGDGTPRFQLKYPSQTIERLDKTEDEISGPGYYRKKIPAGKLMGAVAMNSSELKRIDLTGYILDDTLKWKVPSGKWKIMLFNCVIDGVPIADYLNPDAVRNFTGMVHDAYYARFKGYFGSVIYGTFFDEPSMFHSKFRMWTSQFNEKFRKKYGFSPSLFYPALWYDIGPETGSARNYLYGFRAELFEKGFIKEVNNWSVAHGITATGHIAPEEALIPVNSSGDLMKSFKYLEIPGIDKIGGHRPAERFYKLVSSAACNWDKKLVMSETYGAMPDYDRPGDLNWDQIFSIAMDQYSKGINMLIPHAVWYDNTKVTYKPELSGRNPLYADSLRVFTKFLARLNVMLQPEGRHVADIGVVYPIYTLLGEYYFDGPAGPATIDGFIDPKNEFYKTATAKIDYVDIANWLTNIAGKDYTFLHPEVLDEKCTIRSGKLHLENKTNWEEYKIMIIPSAKTMSVSNLQKIVRFYETGGKVIFTTQLPSRAIETGKDQTINTMVETIFPKRESEAGRIQSNGKGGKACFIPDPDGQKLRATLDIMEQSFDVSYPLNPSLQYLHKVVEGRDLYYFANTGSTAISTQVILQGNHDLECYDPHPGTCQDLLTVKTTDKPSGGTVTKANLNLKPYQSCFWVNKGKK